MIDISESRADFLEKADEILAELNAIERAERRHPRYWFSRIAARLTNFKRHL